VAQAADEAVHVHSVQEEFFYMMVHPCACGGAWQGDAQQVDESGGQVRHRVSAQCWKCKTQKQFAFVLHRPKGPEGPVRQINSTNEPSRALDVAEWMDLAKFYLGRIERLAKPVEKAQSLLDARQCLEEALKHFGPEDSRPPATAFWSDKSRQAAARQPQAFRRAAIQEMLDRIPPIDRLRESDRMEQREFKKALKAQAKLRVGKWWQFWKRFGR
jgi:hypothetical protein